MDVHDAHRLALLVVGRRHEEREIEPEREKNAPSDFPSIWLQRPRQGMHLHWDGNNAKVEERNKSAAFALELIITSVVGSRFDNKVLNEGVALIDAAIEGALTSWRKSNAPAVPN